jgi:hypothetical protein
VVQVNAANDLALLKAVGAFKPLPIAASRTVKLGGTVATVGFPGSGIYEETRKPGGRISFMVSWIPYLIAISVRASSRRRLHF